MIQKIKSEQDIYKIIGSSGCYFLALANLLCPNCDKVWLYKYWIYKGYMNDDCYINDTFLLACEYGYTYVYEPRLDLLTTRKDIIVEFSLPNCSHFIALDDINFDYYAQNYSVKSYRVFEKLY